MKTRLIPVFLVLALVLPAVAAQQRGGRGGKYDQQIQQDVSKELQKQDKWKDVRAATEDGVVTLQGTVPVLIDKANLERKIKGIDHVQGLRDLVQVSSNVPDSELQQKFADKLRYDRIGHGITFNSLNLGLQNGVIVGRQGARLSVRSFRPGDCGEHPRRQGRYRQNRRAAAITYG